MDRYAEETGDFAQRRELAAIMDALDMDGDGVSSANDQRCLLFSFNFQLLPAVVPSIRDK